MGFFSKLFGKKDFNTKLENNDSYQQLIQETAKAESSVSGEVQDILKKLAAEKDARPAVTESELFLYFSVYFAPNSEFYSIQGSEMYNAYFNVINSARDELLRNPDLFKLATKWDISKLIDLLENPQPGLTNILICGLIFRTGDYCVLKANVLCVDFCEHLPNCIAIYLLLTARKLPEGQRHQIIDAGDNTDQTSLKKAMQSLRILDPNWSFTFM